MTVRRSVSPFFAFAWVALWMVPQVGAGFARAEDAATAAAGHADADPLAGQDVLGVVVEDALDGSGGAVAWTAVWDGERGRLVSVAPAGRPVAEAADPDTGRRNYVFADGSIRTAVVRAGPDGRWAHLAADGTREPVMMMDLSTGDRVYLFGDGRTEAVGEYEDALALQRERSGGWGTITFYALVDGINPCAFASIVMLVSMMATARRTRRETVVIGLSFTVAVYLAYMAIGWAFYGILLGLKSYLVVSDLVYYAAFGLCVACGALSLWDAFKVWRTGDAGAMTLQLSKGFKRRIQKALSTGVRSSRLAAGTFVAGLLVSGLEAACTGQVFFPFVAQLKEADPVEAALKLAWYCFVFVLPLVAVFGLALLGVTNQQLGDWMKRNLVMTKLLLAAVFVVMAFMLWPYLMWPPGHRASQEGGGPPMVRAVESTIP